MSETERTWFRASNTSGLVTLQRSDDTGQVQTHQIEGFQTEIRDGMQRQQEFGISTMPLPGSKGLVIYQSGHRGAATVIATEDPRYRPRGLNPGEMQSYIVDGAAKDGTGGTTRAILQGLLGWVAKLLGATIIIGDGNTQNVTVTASNLIKLAGPVQLNGNAETTGNQTVDGNLTVRGTTFAAGICIGS